MKSARTLTSVERPRPRSAGTMCRHPLRYPLRYPLSADGQLRRQGGGRGRRGPQPACVVAVDKDGGEVTPSGVVKK